MLDTVSKTLVIPLYMIIVTDNLFPEILKKNWTSWKTIINDVVEIFSIANGAGEKIFVVVAVLMIFIIVVLSIILILGAPIYDNRKLIVGYLGLNNTSKRCYDVCG